MTSREFHITARATATDWRWPPESVATVWRIERIVVTREALHRLARLRLHLGSRRTLERVVRLAAEVHVLDDVEVVAEREVLVDDLDPEPGGVLRAVDRDRLAVEEHLALVDRVDPGDALDQRRLAGAVVADERHHLACADLEVDVRQRLHGAEDLRDSADLEKGRRRVDVMSLVMIGVEVEAPAQGAPHRSCVRYLQYFAYSPLQMSLLFR